MGECGAIHHLGHSPLPSYREVVDVSGGSARDPLSRLRLAAEPASRQRRLPCGRPDRQPARPADAADRTCSFVTIADLDDRERDLEAKAQAIVIRFLETLPDLRRIIAEDVQAAFVGDPAAKSHDEIVFCYPGVAAVSVYRLAHELHRLDVPLIPRMMTEYAHGKTGIDNIHRAATIGQRFFIDHGTGVVIGETTKIGCDVKLYQGVTLGAISFPRDAATGQIVRDAKRHPTLEDGVVIYANATVLGGETVIGHHSVIGSSAWVMHSVPPHTTVTIENPVLRYRERSDGVGASEYLRWLNYQI